MVEEHTESQSGHEELYVVATGRATFTVGDDTQALLQEAAEADPTA